MITSTHPSARTKARQAARASVRLSDHQGTVGLPIQNVKLHGRRFPSTLEVADALAMSFTEAERAVTMALEMETEAFWDDAQDLARTILRPAFPGDAPTTSATGRNCGWLVVRGLRPASTWTLRQVRAWDAFGDALDRDITRRLRLDTLVASITANGDEASASP